MPAFLADRSSSLAFTLAAALAGCGGQVDSAPLVIDPDWRHDSTERIAFDPPGALWMPDVPDMPIDQIESQAQLMRIFWGDSADAVASFWSAGGTPMGSEFDGFPVGRRLGSVRTTLEAGRATLLEQVAESRESREGRHELIPGVRCSAELGDWDRKPHAIVGWMLNELRKQRKLRQRIELEPAARTKLREWIASKQPEYDRLRDELQAIAVEVVTADLEGLSVEQPPHHGDLFLSPFQAGPSPRSIARLRALPLERHRWRFALTLDRAKTYPSFIAGVYTLQLDDDPRFAEQAQRLVEFEKAVLAEFVLRVDGA